MARTQKKLRARFRGLKTTVGGGGSCAEPGEGLNGEVGHGWRPSPGCLLHANNKNTQALLTSSFGRSPLFCRMGG